MSGVVLPRAVVVQRVEAFGGVVFSDDMEMKAIRDRWPLPEGLDRSTRAGVDCYLVCEEQDRQLRFFEELVRLQEREPTQDQLAKDSLRRITAHRNKVVHQ